MVFEYALVTVRADRLLAVLMLLQRRKRTTARELAERLEVSVRTIYRDVEALAASGVPIYAEPGRNGGVRLVEGYRTDLSGLSLGEAELVPLLGLGDALAGLGFERSVGQTEAKVMSALPEAQRERAEHFRRKIHVDLSAWWHGTETVPHLETLTEAAFAGRRVRMRYRRGGDGKTVSRTIDPLGLVLKNGIWYLVAASGKGDPRTYRAVRVLAAHITDEEVDVRDDFELGAWWSARRTQFEDHGVAYHVVVNARRDAVHSLTNEYEADAVLDEWTRLTLTFGGREHALRRLLGFGASVEVVEPAELRRSIAETLREAVTLY
jgi:predicted DNA-binding transcriptional regulator YafY